MLIHNERGIKHHFNTSFQAELLCNYRLFIITNYSHENEADLQLLHAIHLTFLQFHRLMFSALQTKHQGFKIMTSINNKNTCIFHRWLHVQKYYKSHSMQNPQAWPLSWFTVTPPPKKIWLHTRKIHHHKHHPHARKSHHEAVSLSSFPAREHNNYIWSHITFEHTP